MNRRAKSAVYICGLDGCDTPLDNSRDAVHYATLVAPCEGVDGVTTPLPLRVCSPSCEHRGSIKVIDLDRYYDALAGV